jgi:predicted anti-sigma-YlaC factor YlaD
VSTVHHHDEHERARMLIALSGPEALAPADQTWLSTHLGTCVSCRAFADNARETIHALRAIPVAADRSLVSTTQARVRRRALELQRQRERLWLVSISCVAVTLCALLTSVVLWRGFAWFGQRAQLNSSIWQIGFLVFCVTPALVVGVILLARGTHLSDHSGSYQG